MKRFSVLLFVMTLAGPLAAQAPAPPPAGDVTNVAVDPIRCWWRTSAGAIRIGETFDLSLTCAVLENEAVQVVPDESRLNSAVVALAPFDVVGGSHPADLRSGDRRFFQYLYTLRLINPDVFGKDVRVPDIVIHYRINSRVAANASVQGRDLTYVPPLQPIRVLSMVPPSATDIRDSSGEDFAVVEAMNVRAGTLEVIAIACLALGTLMILIVLFRLARHARKRTPVDERLMTTHRIVSAAARALADVQREREQGGWTDTLVERALAATRIAAACALGRQVAQRAVRADDPEGEGRLRVKGPVRGKPRIVSSPVTARDITQTLSKHPPSDGEMQLALDEMGAALKAFSTTQYGPPAAALDQSALDTALASAVAATRRVQGKYTLIKDLWHQLAGALSTSPAKA